ncbi:MAG: ATP-binding protein [Nitrospirae bacterium]|nr:ATP-binding protein [Nitrospirota bacterium]
MGDFLEKIKRAWTTSSLYKRRVSILLLSHDRNYTLERICQNPKEGVLKDAPFYHLSADGKKKLKDKGSYLAQIPVNVNEEVFAENESILKKLCDDTKEAGIYIIDDFLKQLDDRDAAAIGHQIWINRQLFFDLFEKTLSTDCDAQVFIFLEHSEKRELIPDIVDAEIQIIEHPYPIYDEVKDIVAKELINYKARATVKIDKEDEFITALSRHFSGFAYSTISWMLRDSLITHVTNNKIDTKTAKGIINEVANRKEELINKQLGMNILKSTTYKPIGVDTFLSYIEKRKDRICIPGQERLKGVLLIGPPGTGKSMLAKYLSAHLDKPAVEVQLSSLMSKWMGETEQLFQRLTNVLDAMAPVIIYMDEIEKMFSDEGVGSSAGASMVRATGSLLTWMNDTNSPVFIVATANNISRMGEIGLTMTRRGRFDALFYIGYPDENGRKELFKFYAKNKKFNLTDAQYITLAKMAPFFTGADISGVVQEASTECIGVTNPDCYQNLVNAINLQKARVEAMRAMYNANTGGVMKRLAIPAGNFENES